MVAIAGENRMRIVIDARESGTSTGRYVDKLVEYLHRLKPEQEFIILTKSPRVNYFKELTPNFEVVKSNFKEFGFSEQLGLLRQIKSLKPDLVHFTMTQQPVRYHGRKLTTIHDLTTARFDNPTKNQLVFKTKQSVYKWVIKKVATDSMAVITPSQFVKQDVAKFANINPAKIAVTYEAADKIAAKPEPVPRLSNKQFIMYVGRATPHKNLARLVEAFEVLKKKYPRLMLVFVGKFDANYHQLEALASHKRLAADVVFTDFVSEGQLRWLYENTAAYIFPSLSEGFGLPGLEAMVHGAPVVAAKVTCLPEIYGPAAEYFDPRVTFDIAQKISGVISDQKHRDHLIKAGRSQAAKYSWQTMARQTLEIYSKALGK
ncbi:glycosyltransferase family 4 protein [Candidatus Saccharibacteria bacterium]|nr:glycosyltransferase family 4 protein [Candidatus Saccharibacteria bacterium]